MSGIIPFDFEEQAVRVVMRTDEPWFVAADVCRVLEIANTTQAVQRLDEDEVTLCQIEGSHRPTNLVSESGLYALVIRSDKPAARRFRKWITAEVLPAIRRTGRYDPLPAAAPVQTEGDIAGIPYREAELWLSMVREARLTRGARAGSAIWDRSPLPRLGPTVAATDPASGWRCLSALLAAQVEGVTVADWLASGQDDPALARVGLRILPHGLFIANSAELFAATQWAAGGHRAALLALPGVSRDEAVRTLQGVGARGLVLPTSVLNGGSNA